MSQKKKTECKILLVYRRPKEEEELNIPQWAETNISAYSY